MTYKFDDEHDIEIHHPVGDGPYWAHLINRTTHQRVVVRVESMESDLERARAELERKIREQLKKIN